MTTNKPEVVARLLTWAGPRHEPVPWDGVCARTFAEFPLENLFHGHWKEGEPLIRLSDYKTLQAECEKLRNLLVEIERGCSRRDTPSEQTISSWADAIDTAIQGDKS